jgi:hypothetical protein
MRKPVLVVVAVVVAVVSLWSWRRVSAPIIVGRALVMFGSGRARLP